MPTLTLAELGQFVTDHYRSDVLRVETRQRYDSASERAGVQAYLAGDPPPPDAGDTPWVRQLRAHASAGRRWRVLHAVVEPLSPYLRYEAEWGYVHNAAAGQEIRIAPLTDAHLAVGDLLVVDERYAFRYRYDDADRFVDAAQLDADEAAELIPRLQELWAAGEPFERFWATHPQYHRAVTTA